jgi:uncharacterized membrane protein YsdA (DUF1294 family)
VETLAWVGALYVVTSALAYAAYARDKASARSGGRRIPERRLHALELLGGWPGALLARRILRHKTRKAGYSAVLGLIAVLHLAAWALALRVLAGG